MAVASTPQQSGTARDTVVETFVAAWNTTDEAERRRLLEQCWADDGAFIHSSGLFEGREVVLNTIARMSGTWPVGTQVRISRVEEHNGWLYYAWEIMRTDRSNYPVGLHLAERAADGRLQKLINFEGPALEVGG